MKTLDEKLRDLYEEQRRTDKIRREAHKNGNYSLRDMARGELANIDQKIKDFTNSTEYRAQQKEREKIRKERKMYLDLIEKELACYDIDNLSIILAGLKTGNFEVNLTAEK